MAHNHQGWEHISRGACRHLAWYKVESPRLGKQVEELGEGGVKGEWVGGGGGGGGGGGAPRGVVPSQSFKPALQPSCP